MAVGRARSDDALAGIVGGYAPLDSGLLIPAAYLPSTSPASTLAPTSDTSIYQGAATTNDDAGIYLIVADKVQSSSFGQFALMTFDISSLTGKKILAADLRLLTVLAGGSANAGIFTGHFVVRRILRAYSPTQVTYNVWSTGNNWTTAGARSTMNDVDVVAWAQMVWPGANNYENDMPVVLDLAKLFRYELGLGNTTCRILIGTDVATGSQNGIAFYSLEHSSTTKRPIVNLVTAA